MYKCDHCDYKSEKIWCINRHVKNKHASSKTGAGAAVPMEQTVPHNSQNKKHSNLQEENIDQFHENIDQWQKAHETLKEQFYRLQQEKVTTFSDGRLLHVSIQLY